MPDDAQAGIKPKVEVGGSPLSDDLAQLLELVVVDDHLHLPDMFMLSFRDSGHDVAQHANLQIGTKVKISVPSPEGGSGAALLIDGEVTALEAEYDALGSRAVV